MKEKNEIQSSRLHPRPGQEYYYPLRDLLEALRFILQRYPCGGKKVLDFGAGYGPYQPLFAGCRSYEKADIGGNEQPDHLIDSATSRVTCREGAFDVVFSSQVLEHVENPQQYLKEAFRVLSPGGTLILSTHGVFEDHPVPIDLWRWTGQGLDKIVREAGFSVDELLHFTCGPRAAATVLEMNLRGFGASRFPVGQMTKLAGKICSALCIPRLFHGILDRATRNYRFRSRMGPFQGIYIGLLIVAKKSQDKGQPH